MAHAETFTVEVAYALPRRQLILELRVDEGTTAEQAIRASGMLEQFPEIDLKSSKVGVFGKPCKLTDTLHDGDRVEIYRPLIADPKEIRKQRAAKGKEMKKGAGSEE
jgi:putative ubiquitin-RnfH superfamily antitoxin RatB of RatAB toxin-antitoxin module